MVLGTVKDIQTAEFEAKINHLLDEAGVPKAAECSYREKAITVDRRLHFIIGVLAKRTNKSMSVITHELIVAGLKAGGIKL